MKLLQLLFTLYLVCCMGDTTLAQNATDEKNSLRDSRLFIEQVGKKASRVETGLSEKTAAYLNKLAHEEEKLKKKLYKKDSLAARQFFENEQTYTQLRNQLKNGVKKISTVDYLPKLDTLQTALKFLNREQSGNSSLGLDKLSQSTLGSLDGLKKEFNQSASIESFIRQRQQLLKDKLQSLGMVKQLKQLQKHAYYYRQQVEEYKQLLNDQSKLETKALELLQSTTAFKSFFNKHSELASLFGSLGRSSGIDEANAATLQGPQTRAVLQQELQQRFGYIPDFSAAGNSTNNPVQQNINAAQNQVDQLKAKLKNGISNSDEAIDQPDFVPNTQHVKRLLQRLEPSLSVQSQGANKWLPSTSDIAFTLGYKLNDKSIIGLGASYKLGWGKPIKDTHLSHEGFGLRSFLDWRIKGIWWVSGGFEFNYQQSFKELQELHNNVDVWQKSAVVGITQKLKIGKKSNNIQLLYDFLWRQQTPNGQAIKFRVGFGL